MMCTSANDVKPNPISAKIKPTCVIVANATELLASLAARPQIVAYIAVARPTAMIAPRATQASAISGSARSSKNAPA